MLFHRREGPSGKALTARRLGGIGLLLVTMLGCDERDRLTFPVHDGLGPEVTITSPSQDTSVPAGPFALVGGRVTDADGIDTVYFEVVGGGALFPPYLAGGDDTVSFSLPIATGGFSGITMVVTVFGTDVAGVRGDTAIRQISVQ